MRLCRNLVKHEWYNQCRSLVKNLENETKLILKSYTAVKEGGKIDFEELYNDGHAAAEMSLFCSRFD